MVVSGSRETNEMVVKREFAAAFGNVEAKIRVGESVAIKLTIEWDKRKPVNQNGNLTYSVTGKSGRAPHGVRVWDILNNAKSFVKSPQLDSAITIVTIKAHVDKHDVLNIEGEATYTSGVN